MDTLPKPTGILIRCGITLSSFSFLRNAAERVSPLTLCRRGFLLRRKEERSLPEGARHFPRAARPATGSRTLAQGFRPRLGAAGTGGDRPPALQPRPPSDPPQCPGAPGPPSAVLLPTRRRRPDRALRAGRLQEPSLKSQVTALHIRGSCLCCSCFTEREHRCAFPLAGAVGQDRHPAVRTVHAATILPRRRPPFSDGNAHHTRFFPPLRTREAETMPNEPCAPGAAQSGAPQPEATHSALGPSQQLSLWGPGRGAAPG